MADNQNKSSIENLYDEIDIQELSAIELTEEEKKIFEVLDSDIGFQVAVEKIIANIGDELDTAKIQSKLLLLLYEFFKSKMGSPSHLRTMMLKRKKSIDEDIKKMSIFVIQTHSQIVRQASQNITLSKDKYEYLTKQSRDNLRNTIKRFAVYELYKFITPRRIAGETRRQNFIHNMLLGGLKYASHFEGGTKSELQKYTPQFLQKLERQHKKFTRGGKTSIKGMMI